MDLPLRNSRIKLSSGQVFWREVGQGPILIFLHGSWNDSSQWLPVIEFLNQDYHCFAPDLLGFGDSPAPNLHYSIHLEVECLGEYLEALHLWPVYLIGHSLGGWIAASYALNNSDQVRGLVLLAPQGVQVPGKQENGWWTRWLAKRSSLAPGMLRVIRPLAKLFGRHKSIDKALQQRQQFLASPAACQLLFQRRQPEVQEELLQEKLELLKVPTLILQGRRDSPNAIASSQVYASKISGSQLRMIDHGGNDLPEALPGLVARQIHDFINPDN